LIQLATIFTDAAESSNVKAILSSRPLLELKEPLGPAQLQLHDLTHDDITAYVDEELKKNPRMVELFDSTQGDAISLVEEIVNSANGVFLWYVFPGSKHFFFFFSLTCSRVYLDELSLLCS